LEDIIHLGCFRLLLESLNVKDICLLGACNHNLSAKFRQELSKRKDIWIRGTSRSWHINNESGELVGFADDFPFERGISGLGPVLEHVVSETELFETIATWCGGWAPLLYARETSPREQPRLRNKGRSVQFSTPGIPSNSSSEDDSDSSSSSNGRDPCLPLLIFDIHCEGKWMWSAIHPVRAEDHENMTTDVDEEEADLDVIYLESTKTLGEAWDAATFLTRNLGNRPPRYLITTHPEDNRLWALRCSIVSPYCSETLVIEGEIRVVDSMREPGSKLAPNSGLGALPPNVRHDDRTFRPDALLFRSVNELSVEDEVYGIPDTYELKAYQAWMTFHYFWDRRYEENGKEKFHIILHEFNCESDLVHNMIANIPYPAGSTVPFTRRR
jgi:hypothetical protein